MQRPEPGLDRRRRDVWVIAHRCLLRRKILRARSLGIRSIIHASCQRQETCPPTGSPSAELLGAGLLRQFRAELFQAAAERGYPDLREPHLHIFGNVGVDGIRLTDLAARAQLSLATTSELVSELQRLGYLERRADGTDRRAKLIFPTPRGQQALDDAGDEVAQLEQRWAHIAGPQRFADTCRTLQDLLDTLTSNTNGPDPAAVAAKVTEASHTGPATEDVIRRGQYW